MRPSKPTDGGHIQGSTAASPLLIRVQMAFVFAAFAATTAAAVPKLGFAGPEMFPIEPQIGLIRAADLDGDGRLDLVLANNQRSRINILWNRTGQTNLTPSAPLASRELNELPPDARFQISSITSEKRISALVLADLNNDQRIDIAYYGEPKELVVQVNQGSNQWSSPKRWRIDDGLLLADALAAGDLNGDHRQDLLLLGEKCLYFIAQDPNGNLGEAERLPYSDAAKGLQILDVNGDDRQDLLIYNGDSAYPIRLRPQNELGQLGPEVFFKTTPFRAYLADDLNHDHKVELITITLNSGRAELGILQQSPCNHEPFDYQQHALQVLPLAKSSKDRRGVLWADLDGDNRTDLLVADPEGGQLNLFLQRADGTFSPSRSFPSLTGIEELAAEDWDGDGKKEVFLLSTEERQVGVTRLDDKGRLTFPESLSLPGRPLSLTVGKLQKDGPPTLAVICDQDGKRSLVLRLADGTVRSQKLSEAFKSNPSAMLPHDADQDGLMDLVVLIRYEKLKVLRQVSGKDFEELDIAPPGGPNERPWANSLDVDNDGHAELLLAQKNFIRSVVMSPEKPIPGSTNQAGWTFKVKEQINGATPDARIIGAALLRCGTNRFPTVFLLDSEHKALTCVERDDSGTWKSMRNLSLPLGDFAKLETLALNAPEPNSLALTGANTVAWLSFPPEHWEITTLAGYESDLKGASLTDLVTGNLTGHGPKDLVFLDMVKNYLDIVQWQPPAKLESCLRWQVFETRSYRSQRASPGEPREALIADFTGDGKNDIVIVVNDRVILYPQD